MKKVKGNNTRIIYASGSFQGQYGLCDISQNVLEAWPKLNGSKELMEWLKVHPDPTRISLLDSGVFSTWSRGDVVDMDKYSDSIHELLDKKLWSHFVGCDQIPGSPNVMPTQEDVEISAKKTWDNFLYMVEKRNVPADRLIPVFHQNESFHWLKNMVDYHDSMIKSGSKEGLYIGISPANDRTSKQRILWLEQCMPYVTHPDGSARLRWHGFGATSTLFMHRYPWYTCDSTSWLRAGSFGAIKVPMMELKYPHYDSNVQVAMTLRSGESEKHFQGLAKGEQDWIVAYIEKNGFTLEQVAGDGKEGVLSRQTINLRFWKQLEKELNTMDNRWKQPQGTFV